MAYIQLQFYSNALSRQVEVQVLLPNDSQKWATNGNSHYLRPMKSLYLLHGYSGSQRDWLLNGHVQELSLKYNLAIILPSGENSFYLNQKGSGNAFSTFIGSELPAYISSTLGLSSKLEDNLIGGFSMGGFGAIHVGVSYPTQFSKVIGLSSALIIHDIHGMSPESKNPIADYDYYVRTFGDLNVLASSNHNPEMVIDEILAANKSCPNFYIACGTEDMLIEHNRLFHRFLLKRNVPVHYVEGTGNHNFDYWNQHLELGVQWALTD